MMARGALWVAAFGFVAASGPLRAAEPAKDFGDPFLQVTGAIAGCPAPQRSTFTEEQMRAEAHSRAERGTRCFQSGRCRLPSSYDYDKEIVPRVKKAILADGRFSDTSIWAEGQRRWVWLKGCVRTRADAVAAEKLVREIDDVERVINELVVKAR
jgi:hypothetical protein